MQECPTSYSVDHVEHYRYNGARQRYLVQVLDPDDPDPEKVLSDRRSEYDGDDVYGDFIIDEGQRPRRSARSSRVTSGVSEGDGWTDDYHADHLGTTRRLTDPDGESIAPGRS